MVLGSDWPYDMGLDSPVEWVKSMKSLTAEEKAAIISDNPAKVAWHVGLTHDGSEKHQRSSPPLMSIRHYQALLRPDVRRRFYTKWDVRRTPACSYMALTAISWSSQRTDIRRICSMSDCIKK